MRKFNDEEFDFCNYGLALTTTAMVLGRNRENMGVVGQMVNELKSRIHDSRVCEFYAFSWH